MAHVELVITFARMKVTLRYFLLASLLLVMAACSTSKKADFSTPEGTFAELVESIHAKDIDRYAACWHSERANGDGIVPMLREQPALWDGLIEMFPKGSTITSGQVTTEKGREMTMFEVHSDHIENGEKENMVGMVKEGDRWWMWHW